MPIISADVALMVMGGVLLIGGPLTIFILKSKLDAKYASVELIDDDAPSVPNRPVRDEQPPIKAFAGEPLPMDLGLYDIPLDHRPREKWVGILRKSAGDSPYLPTYTMWDRNSSNPATPKETLVRLARAAGSKTKGDILG